MIDVRQRLSNCLRGENPVEWLIGAFPVILLVLVCPLMMIFMMRGMHGGHGQPSGRHDAQADDRIAELEDQVRQLREERDRKREKVA
jgi:hypothetical protein